MQWQAWILLGSVFLFLTVLILMLVRQMRISQLEQSKLVESLQQSNQNLLNRLMSKDIQAYQVMQASTTSLTSLTSDEYIPRTDQAEYQRAVEAARVNGLGDINLGDDDTELNQTMIELGLFQAVEDELGDKHD